MDGRLIGLTFLSVVIIGGTFATIFNKPDEFLTPEMVWNAITRNRTIWFAGITVLLVGLFFGYNWGKGFARRLKWIAGGFYKLEKKFEDEKGGKYVVLIPDTGENSYMFKPGKPIFCRCTEEEFRGLANFEEGCLLVRSDFRFQRHIAGPL